LFAARWPSRSGELADRINGLPKYVVSTTLEDPDWSNPTILAGDVVNGASKLKQELNGQVVVWASFQLGRTLIEHDLFDGLRLKIYPVVLGAGDRLFGEISDTRPLRLVEARSVDGDVAYLTYERVRDA
jgi:dihydrofolate reductase